MTRLQKLTEEMHKCFRCNLCKMIPMPVVRNPDFMDAKRHLVNMALREHVVEESHALPAHEETIRNWRERGHQRGAAAALAGQWARGLGLKQLPGERADVLLFAGCRGGRGGVPAAFPALAASAARERVREAGAVGGAPRLWSLPATSAGSSLP